MRQQPDCLGLDAFAAMLVESEREECHTQVVGANCYTAGVPSISCGPAHAENGSYFASHLRAYVLQTCALQTYTMHCCGKKRLAGPARAAMDSLLALHTYVLQRDALQISALQTCALV